MEHEIGDGTSYIGYTNLDLPIAADTLTLKANGSRASAQGIHIWCWPCMNMPLVEDVADLTADLSYGRTRHA